ncbi:MAG: hypothetical protein M0Z66_17070 [Thermaerobacter sp.]|nr:hypothetical protein [Thermaerobacter sp.]
MKTKFRDHQPDDRMLLPPSFADLLPKEHEAFFVRETVLKADLSQIYGSYTATKGQPPYQPSMMVAIFAMSGWLARTTWPRMRFASLGAEVCLRLPPDPVSRRAPLPLADGWVSHPP